ncbi:MAG TPA: sugar ABC transporter substrate-binding protein, partial [Geminicoccaceae bacterium]|nr:sugar ABC transporter substrate-binding protein [Geminicoccaceae bacterium]
LGGWGATPALAQTPVRVVVAYYSAETGPIFERIAGAFEQENPDIDVRIEVVNWDPLLQKLTTDIAGGTAPDVSIIGTRWLLDFAAQGVAEPLDGYMTDEFKARFIDAFLEPSVIDGQTYGLPVAASARAMYYNERLFERAGIAEPPATWDGLREAARKISDLGDDTYGFGIQGKEIETDAYWYYALWTHGGELIEDDGTSGVDGEAAVRAANLYKGMIDEGLTQPGVTNYNREEMQDLFKQGRLGMILTGPWLRGQMREEAPDVAYGVAPIPEGTTKATYGVTDSIIMFSTSEVKDEAWKFMEFAFREDFRKEFTSKEGFLPVLKAVAEDPAFAGDEELAAFVDMLPNAKFAPTIENWEEIADITSSALQRIYLGQAPAEQALGEAAAEIDPLLK